MTGTAAPRSTIGFLGVGAIAEAMVRGLSKTAGGPSVVLSKRSAARVAELTSTLPDVRAAADNQDLIDGVDTVVVCLRPQDLRPALTDLRFRAEQSIVSVVAGVSVTSMAALVDPARVVARVVPLPAVAQLLGTTIVHPTDSFVPPWLEGLGATVIVDSEDVFDAYSAATATIAAHYRYLSTIASWLHAHGAAADTADSYVRSLFASLPGTAVHPTEGTGTVGGPDAVAVPLREAGNDHATAGGLNQQFAGGLEQAGVFDAVADGLDQIFRRVRGEAPEPHDDPERGDRGSHGHL